MAQLLHRQESRSYGKDMQGCRWSFLQFFGLHRRSLRSNKMLSDKKHAQQKCTGGSRLRGCYMPSKNDDSSIIDDHENTQVTNKHKGSKKNSDKAGLRSFISRKLYGKGGQKEKMLPVAPRLLRTLSYLESNVYVFDGESSANGDASSHGAKFSSQNAAGTNLQHNSLDGSIGDEHVKRKSHRSISMDGILHKVPYGQKLSRDTIIEELPRSASATYHRDGLKPYTGTAAKRHLNHGIRRSRSLSESLESYSHLLDSISNSEAKRVLTSSKSTRDHSNSQLRSKGMTRLAEYLVIPEDASASHAPEKIVVGFESPVLLQDYSSGQKRDLPLASEEVVHVSEEPAAPTSDDDLSHSSADTDSCTLLSRIQSEDIENAKRHMTPFDAQPSENIWIAGDDAMISKDEQIQSFEATCCVSDPKQDTEDELNLGCAQETESPTSVLDVSFLDRTMLYGSWQKENIIHSNGADDSVGGDDLNSSTSVKESTCLSIIQEDLQDLEELQAGDPQKQAALDYVKDIFSKSSFTNEALFDVWRSENMARLQDEACQHSDLSFSAVAASDLAIVDMSADEFLLFDLTNEALFDMYKRYAASGRPGHSWLSSSDLRPKPVGRRAMEELWDRVSLRLDEQPIRSGSGMDVEAMMLSDLAKEDRWLELRWQGDEVGDEVADFLLDRLVTDLALQLAKF